MIESKEFPIESVLSVSTGRLFGEIGGVYEILNFMTGEDLFTHQLPRAAEACRPALRAQHPALSAEALAHDIASIDGAPRDDRPALLHAIVRRLSAENGAKISVQMAAAGYAPMDPIEELLAMAGGEGMIDWQPIETAPKDGTTVLVLYEVGHDKYRYAAQAVSYSRHWEGAMDDDWVPTRWAPINLPEDA